MLGWPVVIGGRRYLLKYSWMSVSPLSSHQKVPNNRSASHLPYSWTTQTRQTCQYTTFKLHLACPGRTRLEMKASRTLTHSPRTPSLLTLRSQRQGIGHLPRLGHGITWFTRRNLKPSTVTFTPLQLQAYAILRRLRL